MIRPERIAHVVIKVRDLERSRKFYSEVLGLQLMKELPQFKISFLASNGRDHHEIGLIEVGADAPSPRPNAVGLAHFAFRLENEERLRAAYRELKAREVPISFTVNHGITKSIYFRDPDNNELEVYCDNPPEEYARMPNSYGGMEKLDFAPEEHGLADMFEQMKD